MSELSQLIHVDRVSPVPLYFQVAQQLEQSIESGSLPPGSKLDNEIQLAEGLGLSRPTMRRAIQHLVDKGMLVRKRGVGTTVVYAKVRRPVQLTSLYDDLSGSGQRPRTTVLYNAVTPATGGVAAALGVEAGTPVVALERLRYAQDEPIAELRNFLPTTISGLTTEALEQRGLYQVLRSNGVTLHAAHQSIGARCATTAEARLLDEKKGSPLLTMERTTYNDRGEAVEYATHVYRASRYSFELNLLAR